MDAGDGRSDSILFDDLILSGGGVWILSQESRWEKSE